MKNYRDWGSVTHLESSQMESFYAVFLLLLGVWSLFSSPKHVGKSGIFSWHLWLSICATCLLAFGGFTAGVALFASRFSRWMLLPIGVSYICMLPLPCYFHSLTSTARRRAIRNSAFGGFALFLLALGVGIIPLSVIGIELRID
jgi:hypothetical protein